MDDIRSSPDRQLVDAVLANRPGAFERLVREYQGLCWHIIARMVRNPRRPRTVPGHLPARAPVPAPVSPRERAEIVDRARAQRLAGVAARYRGHQIEIRAGGDAARELEPAQPVAPARHTFSDMDHLTICFTVAPAQAGARRLLAVDVTGFLLAQE
ncbi:hypothetical protein [Rhodanobacter lindaniclasticus]